MKYIKEGMAEGAEKFEAEDNDMKECRQLFQELITENLVQIICSNTRDADRAAKAKIRPVPGNTGFSQQFYPGRDGGQAVRLYGNFVQTGRNYLRRGAGDSPCQQKGNSNGQTQKDGSAGCSAERIGT